MKPMKSVRSENSKKSLESLKPMNCVIYIYMYILSP